MKEMLISDAQGLSNMSNLRLLVLANVKFKGSLNCLSNNLQYLEWHEYPFSNLPSNFQPENLVELNLKNSDIKHLWKGIKHLPHLRGLNLRNSKNLIEVPDFGGVLNLEWIFLGGCTKLARIHPSVGLLRKLAYLELENCKSLVSLPSNIFCLSSLEYLDISGCSKVFSKHLIEKSKHEEHSQIPDIRETTMQSQSTSSSIIKILMLPFHYFFYFRRSKSCHGWLLPSMPSFFCLRFLDISFCNLRQIPDAIGSIHSLEFLNLAGNNFIRLPSSINELSKLVYLNLEHCKQLICIPAMPVIRGSDSFEICEGGLFIFNCPKIVDIESWCGMTFAWLLQILQVNQESATPIGLINIVIPGNRIPRWINNQSVGTSIYLDVSPIKQKNNWIGVVCAVVFAVLDYPTSLDISKWEPSIEIGFVSNIHNFAFGAKRIPIHFDKDLITDKSHHLWLLYLSREEFLSCCKIERIIDLYGRYMKTEVVHPGALGLRLTSCGYHWVFKEDLKIKPKPQNSAERIQQHSS